jgi:hypothetical protein
MAWLEGEIDPKPSSECATLPGARGFAVQLRSGGDIQRPNQTLQCVAATVIPMAKGISEATTIPIPVVLSLRANLHSASFGWAIATFWIRRAITLALAASITPIPKHTKQL